MNISPEQFISFILDGKTEKELNKTARSHVINISELNKLMSEYGHSLKSATEHLTTDYSNGFTICKSCGSFYHLGKGFTKHLSNGCLHCEGEEKHRICHVNASKPSEGGFPARYMSQMFDDGMSYCKDKIQIEKYKQLIHFLP